LRRQPKSTARLTKKPWSRWYSTQRWRRMAKHQVDVVEPLCQECKRLGHVVRATVADHVEPHRGDETAFWTGELQSLCSTCHLRKLGYESAERRTGKPARRIIKGCTPDGMPLDPDHWWNRDK
jgi:5-methylcytosine-specific restriction protein A